MPKYLVSGKDSQGRSTTEFISASSTDEAVQLFKSRGFSDVVLHTDEVVSHLLKPEAMKHLTPRDFLAMGRVSRINFLGRMILRLYRQQWWLFGLMAALVLGRRALGSPWEFIDTAAVAFLLMPPFLVLIGELFSPSRKFERAIAYNAWGRWAEMLRALTAVRSYLSPAQYAFLQAKALAGLGRLDEALETVRSFADDPKTPSWLYWAQLAEVFAAAKLGDRVIECGEKAVELAPGNVTVLVDLAMAKLRYRRDAAGARPLFERAKTHAISDMLAPFLIACEGVLLLEERQPAKARPLLDAALKQMEPLRHTTALMSSAIDRVHTYLAITCAELGDSTEAERHFRIAEPRLRAFAADDLLDRCRPLLGTIV